MQEDKFICANPPMYSKAVELFHFCEWNGTVLSPPSHTHTQTTWRKSIRGEIIYYYLYWYCFLYLSLIFTLSRVEPNIYGSKDYKQRTIKPSGCSVRQLTASLFTVALAVPQRAFTQRHIKQWAINCMLWTGETYNREEKGVACGELRGNREWQNSRQSTVEVNADRKGVMHYVVQPWPSKTDGEAFIQCAHPPTCCFFSFILLTVSCKAAGFTGCWVGLYPWPQN